MRIHYPTHAFFLTLVLAGFHVGVAKAADVVEEIIKVCAAISERDARLACYDSLGQRVLGSEPAAADSPPDSVAPAEATAVTAPAEAAPTTPVVPSLPDHLGGTVFEKNGEGEARGLVTSCSKGRDNRWYFYFEDGQIWRESNASKRRFKECRFIVTISRDGFGYRMQIDGKKAKIRVGRLE